MKINDFVVFIPDPFWNLPDNVNFNTAYLIDDITTLGYIKLKDDRASYSPDWFRVMTKVMARFYGKTI